MKNWVFGLSGLLNLILLVVLIFLNERYGLWAKVQRVALVEGRVPGLVPEYELNRNYQVRREMFRLDRSDSARILMLGDSLTAQGEWNAMLGEPLVANRGIDGDTSAGVLARIGDDADFGGDAVVIWIGTNDVLQGLAAGPVAERIMEAARGKAEKMKRNLTTENTEGTENLTKQTGADEEIRRCLAGHAGPSSPATAPKLQVFVLGILPMARWWEGAPEKNSKIQEINIMLAKEADGNGYRFVELESVLSDENGFLRADMTSDGVHLNAKGYVAVLEKMKQGPLHGQ